MHKSSYYFIGSVVLSLLLIACSGGDGDDTATDPGNTNTGPSLTLSPIGNKQVLAGERLTFTVSTSDTNPDGGTLSFTADGNAGLNGNPLLNGASFDEMSRVFDWQTDSNDPAAVYSIRFTVTDSSPPPDSDSELINISIMSKYEFGESKYQQHCQSCHGVNGMNGSATLIQCVSVASINEALGLVSGISAARNMGGIAGGMDNVTRDVDAISHFLTNVATC